MIQVIQTLRDFLDEEQLKWLPGNLRVENCILLTKHEEQEGITKKVIYVFDNGGALIGKIDNEKELIELTKSNT